MEDGPSWNKLAIGGMSLKMQLAQKTYENSKQLMRTAQEKGQ